MKKKIAINSPFSIYRDKWKELLKLNAQSLLKKTWMQKFSASVFAKF